jgi:hypothetical protein
MKCRDDKKNFMRKHRTKKNEPAPKLNHQLNEDFYKT